jgi:hypothetical protein
MRQNMKLLGKRVRVKLDESVIVTGVLLGFGDDGTFEIGQDGFVHYCWPLLDIEEVADGSTSTD